MDAAWLGVLPREVGAGPVGLSGVDLREDLRVWCGAAKHPPRTQEVLVAHPNAPLSELGRLRLARAIVDQGWSVARAAERFQVSRPTAHRWATRYRDLGAVGMADRSSRPHHSPRRTPAPVVRRIVHLRWTQRLGPAQIAPQVGLAPSTVHAVLSAAASVAWPILTGPAASRSAATSTTIPASWSMSMSRSWATSRPGVATGSWAAPPVPATARRPLQRADKPPPQPAPRSWVHPRRGR